MLVKEIINGKVRKSDGVKLTGVASDDLEIVQRFNNNELIPLANLRTKRSSNLEGQTDAVLVRWFDDQTHITIESGRASDIFDTLHNELYTIGPEEFFESLSENSASFILDGMVEGESMNKLSDILLKESLQVVIEDYRGDVYESVFLSEIFEGYSKGDNSSTIHTSNLFQ